MKINIKNERVKRKFFTWLKQADGCCDSTINSIEKSILLYEDFTKQADFTALNPDKAMKLKKALSKREYRGKTISPTTRHTYLRYVTKFFSWLSWQPGYKSKTSPDIVSYLKISEKEERIATQCRPVKYPPLEYVTKLANSIAHLRALRLRRYCRDKEKQIYLLSLYWFQREMRTAVHARGIS